jgi:uncharacterized protein YebE (UPF0316 family)
MKSYIFEIALLVFFVFMLVVIIGMAIDFDSMAVTENLIIYATGGK